MRLRSAGSLATSLLLHASLLASGAWIVSRSLSSQRTAPPAATLVEVGVEAPGLELPGVPRGGWSESNAAPEIIDPPPTQAFGGERLPRPDTERAGRGGSATGARALNLASSIEDVTLERELFNALHRSQVQRLRTAKSRESRDDRRATPEPMQMTFVASGIGARRERRPVADTAPARGALDGTAPSQRGGTPGGSHELHAERRAMAAGTVERGGEAERRAAGVSDGSARRDVRLSADVALTRPRVVAARAAVPTETRGRPNDVVDSSQEVASNVQALLQASTAGGPAGADRGGTPEAGATGSGASGGSGSRSDAAGFGTGARRSAGDDPRLTDYFRELLNRVDWHEAFPTWAIAEGRGGVAVVGVTLRADGSVADARIVRPSGVAEFDRNVLHAVKRAAPFGAPPKAFGSALRVNLKFDALNPAVGRNGTGRGRGQPR
jgi:TonB family protein